MNDNMQQLHQNDIETLRAALAPLDARCPLPNELKGDVVMENAKEPRAKTAVYLRRGLAFAATLAVFVGSMFAADKLNIFTKGELLLPPEPTTAIEKTEVEPLSTYYDLQKTFLKLQKDYKDATRFDGVRDFFKGRVVYQMEDAEAAPGGTLDDGMDLAGAMEDYNGAVTTTTTAQDEKSAHGETNTQVAGVDEADILKNDGQFLYYVSQNKLSIIKALPANQMKAMASITIPDYRNDTQLYVQGNRMALVYSEYPPGGSSAASVQIYDISDRANPVLVKSFSQKGSMLSSRMQNGRIYLISTQWVNLDFKVRDGAIPEADILPAVYTNGQEELVTADCIAILPETTEPSYLVLSSIDLQSEATETENAAILGAGSQVYCSTEALYVACQQYSSLGGWRNINEKTVIYKFDLLADGKIKPGPTGEVAGSPLNQFAMDEYQNHFRIATTGWDDKKGDRVNLVTVLDKDLKQAGVIGGIAPGESIQSVRFIGTAGYVVTFLQTDPLFVLDLADPKNPKITGELKLPGFSAYLHPWDAKHLIGVGPDGDDRGTNGHLKVSLFDISNPAAPKEVDRVIIKDSWTEIQQNHKIFTACREKGIFGLPINDGYRGGSGFHVFRVEGSTVSGQYALETGTYANIRRGTYIGSDWYLLDANNRLSAYAMDDGKALGVLEF